MSQENSGYKPISLLKWFFLESKEDHQELMLDLDTGLGLGYTGNRIYKTSHTRDDFEIQEAGLRPTGDVQLIYYDYNGQKNIHGVEQKKNLNSGVTTSGRPGNFHFQNF